MATRKQQVYRCEICGNMTEVLHAAGGQLVCCGQPMTLLAENTTDAAQEKHVPVVTQAEGGIRVAVGATAHPMEAEHHIEWIEASSRGEVCRCFLSPGMAPEAMFRLSGDQLTVRAYCNQHGLWQA